MSTSKSSLVPRLSPTLTGKERRTLRGLAHALKPVVMIGQQGVTEGVIASVNVALEDHELIKVKVLNSLYEPLAEVAEALVEGTGAALVQKIGRMLVFYRRNEDEPKIELGS